MYIYNIRPLFASAERACPALAGGQGGECMGLLAALAIPEG
jgi:hypothetical protein